MEIGLEIELLKSLFSGRKDAYGLQTSSIGPFTVKEPLTDSLIQEHIAGIKRIGVLPIRQDGKVNFACLDLDREDEKVLTRLVVTLIEANLYPYVERSKSKGFHVWTFFDEPIEAKIVRRTLLHLLKKGGIDQVEVFPKQETLTSTNGVGNYVFLPLHGESVKNGRTVFLDSTFKPYENQFDILQKIHRTKSEIVQSLFEQIQPQLPEKADNPKVEADEGSLDLGKYLSHHKVSFKIKKDNGRTFYLLSKCFFSDRHTTKDSPGDSAIVQGGDGKITYQCFHAHCKDKTWNDARKAISGDQPLTSFLVGKKPGSSFTVRTWAEYLSTPSFRPEYLVQGYLIPGVLGMISAESKKKKSWFVLQLLMSLATGRPFLDMKIPRPVKCLYIQEELPDFVVEDRLVLLGRHFGQPNDDLLILSQQRVKLVNPKDLQRIADFIIKLKPEVVVFDTWTKVTPGLDQNRTEEVARVLSACREKIVDPTGAAVIFVHHHGHTTDQTMNRSFRSRGSTAFITESQFFVQFYNKSHAERDLVVLETFLTYAPEIPRQIARWNPETYLWEVVNEDADRILSVTKLCSVIGQEGRSRREILELLQKDLGRDVQKSFDRTIKGLNEFVIPKKMGREKFFTLTEKGIKLL